MSGPPPTAPTISLGLAWMAQLLERDLHAAARRAGGPEALWRADARRLEALLGLDAAEAATLALARARLDLHALAGALDASGQRHLDLGHDLVPPGLQELFDAPFGLFADGRFRSALAAVAAGPAVAIVGGRRACPEALAFVRGLAAELGRRGATIVSGMARGVDAAAHLGALDVGAPTVAVLGCGADVTYPAAHRALRGRIGASGAVLSEYWPGTRPAPWRFPARNRIVAGLAHAVVAVEAGARSGALITCDFALELGRPVLAVPGVAGREAVAGCHALIRAGAALCEGPCDVMVELPGAPWREPEPEAVPEGLPATVIAALADGAATVDVLAERLGVDVGALRAAVAALEIEGRVDAAAGRIRLVRGSAR